MIDSKIFKRMQLTATCLSHILTRYSRKVAQHAIRRYADDQRSYLMKTGKNFTYSRSHIFPMVECSRKEITSQADKYLVILSSKTYVSEAKLAKY